MSESNIGFVPTVTPQIDELAKAIADLEAQRRVLAATAEEEIKANRTMKFNEVVSFKDVTAVDFDALAEIGVLGYQVMRSADPNGGPPVVSMTPVVATPAKSTRKTGGGNGGGRDLQGNFEANANAEERAAMDTLIADGNDGNKTWALKTKVWNRTHLERVSNS